MPQVRDVILLFHVERCFCNGFEKMSGWSEKERKRHEDLLRGQGKHEALLLQCRLREHRHPFRDSVEMKCIDREKKKIEAELIKIRHTIHHERRNPRVLSLSTRSLTMEAIAPSRRHSFSVKPDHRTQNSAISPGRFISTRLSLDPSILATADRSLPGKRSGLGYIQRDTAVIDQLVISEIAEVNDESQEHPKPGDVVDGNADNPKLAVNVEAVPQKDEGDVPPVTAEAPDFAADPNSTTVPDIQTNPNVTARSSDGTVGLSVQPVHGLVRPPANQAHLNVPVPRLCHRNPTFVQSRQPTFINRSNTYIKKRRELNNSTDILSCANYNEMRQGIANETLKKLGLL